MEKVQTCLFDWKCADNNIKFFVAVWKLKAFKKGVLDQFDYNIFAFKKLSDDGHEYKVCINVY